MKCPKCGGTRFLGKEWRKASHAFEAQYWDKKCIHCDGTGEIQDGDVWKGECQGIVKILQYHHASGYSFFDAMGELDGYWAEHSEFAPVLICRMKEVK